MRNLGDILVDQGMITPEQLADVEAEHASTGRAVARILVEHEHVTEKELVSALAAQIGYGFVDLDEYEIDPRAATMVADSALRQRVVLPIGFEDGKLIVAISDPSNVVALDDVRTITKMDVRPVVATRDDILSSIGKYASLTEDIEAIADDLGGEEDTDLADLKSVSEDAPIVRFVNLLISQAVADGASDIHIEPGERDLRVRYRIDGVLHEVMRAQRSIQAGVISRLKIMADVDIAERRVPQDGRISITAHGKAIDLRFSTLPTVYGEKVVMRVLDKTSVLLELEDLGFLDHNLRRFEESYRKAYGTILVTGPTGSGKSTTLYAAINVLNTPAKHILTAEDPVEYHLAGVNQVQTNVKAGLTFARALRSFLRCSPDIILVGEIRDQETAKIAIESALTGHLVLSTLHTNDAAGAVTRLTEMGVEPFLVASAVDCVLAQRLARRLCPDCKEEYKPSKQLALDAGFAEDDLPERLWRPKGCKKCGGTGYRGRMGIHEVMIISEEIGDLTVKEATSEAIREVAMEQGMLTLKQDGLEKCRQGQISIEEVARVIV